ncbi:MAG: alpha/beta fold hydrolase [Bdellovibrionales bacterium]|nr:alpha/beta fold hydrolase [Bdellovibrionales bacterium]
MLSGVRLLEHSKRFPLLDDRLFEASGYDVVFRRGSMRLRLYSAWETPAKARVVIFPSLINRPYILDLGRGKSLIQNFQRNGIEVALFDWGIPGESEVDLGLQSLLSDRIRPALNALNALLPLSAQAFETILGHCLGGNLALYHLLEQSRRSKKPSREQRLILLTTPIDFANNSILNTWFRTPTWNPDAFARSFNHIPWPVLQASFLMLKPSATPMKWVDFAKRAKSRDFRESFFQMELWSNDNVSLPSGLFRDLLIPLYRDNDLLARADTLGSFAVKTLALVATDDHIVSLDSAEAVRDILPRVEMIHAKGGHIGAVLSKRTRESHWPKLNEFILSS